MRPIQEPLLQNEALLIFYFVAILLFIAVFAIVFVMAFQKRKNKFLIERLEAEKKFERELTSAQLEIQEQTLKNIAWELHDNVGQLLSVANLQLNLLAGNAPSDLKSEIMETKSLVSESVNEIRTLSKILNTDVVEKNGLVESLRVELERFNRLKFLKADFTVKGDVVSLSNSNEIIIFRILQEFISNVIKHAKANNLFVLLEYGKDALEVTMRDDGQGFDPTENSGNSGMQTMKGRAELLRAQFNLVSSIGAGTTLTLKYPYSTNE
jgi:signal transduction histidine kinase